MKGGRRSLSIDTLLGTPVVDRLGAELGFLEELIVDVESGAVAHALVACRGEEETLVAVPWAVLDVDPDGGRVVLTVRRQTFEGAPRVAREQRPDLADPAWERAIHRHYSQDPSWGGREGKG